MKKKRLVRKRKCKNCHKPFWRYNLLNNMESRICRKCRKKAYVKKCRVCGRRIKVNTGMKVIVGDKGYTIHKNCLVEKGLL